MSNVSCMVSTCEHHCNNLCKLNKIDVDGPGAKNSDQTCCASFCAENSSGAMNNSTMNNNPQPATDICCKATQCIHNSGKKCHANSVNIAGLSSSPCVECDTECLTFSAN